MLRHGLPLQTRIGARALLALMVASLSCAAPAAVSPPPLAPTAPTPAGATPPEPAANATPTTPPHSTDGSADSDGDGIADRDDHCPAEAEDCDHVADDDGCPETDADHDGIADACDRCPLEPETYNGSEDDDGCPDHLVRVNATRIVIRPRIQFRGNSSVLPTDATLILREIAAVMHAHPELGRVGVIGHASNDERAPARLSQARADAVLRALVALGLEPARAEAHGYGATRPITTNATVHGRETNRRVEFELMEIDGRVLLRWTGHALVAPPSTDVPTPVAAPTPTRPPEGSTAPPALRPCPAEDAVHVPPPRGGCPR
jgi:outer membrane protein OmpA-like peptidoglycan-associated protein